MYTFMQLIDKKVVNFYTYSSYKLNKEPHYLLKSLSYNRQMLIKMNNGLQCKIIYMFGKI